MLTLSFLNPFLPTVPTFAVSRTANVGTVGMNELNTSPPDGSPPRPQVLVAAHLLAGVGRAFPGSRAR